MTIFANHPFARRQLNILDENGNEGCAVCSRQRAVHPTSLPKGAQVPKSIAETTQFTGLDSYLDIVARWKAQNTSTLTAEETFQYRRPIMLITTLTGTTAFSPGDWVVWSDQGDVGVVRADQGAAMRDTLRNRALQYAKQLGPQYGVEKRLRVPIDATVLAEGGGLPEPDFSKPAPLPTPMALVALIRGADDSAQGERLLKMWLSQRDANVPA